MQPPPPLLDLFGTFFARLTEKHPHKDQLQKELAEFKSLLSANPPNTQKLETYLASLTTKIIIPANSLRIQADNGPSAGKTLFTSPKSYGEYPSRANTAGGYSKKVEIVPLLDFLKYRTAVTQADKGQVLLNRYSHAQVLEKNPNNLYRTIAIYYFTLVMRSPGSEKKLSDIIDDVAAKRIELYCPVEKLEHDDMCGVFCGYFTQLIRQKRQQESVASILQTFHEMAGYDRAFSVGLASFVKAKIFSFVEQKNFPYELYSLKTHVQSKAFKEKVENNDFSQLDNVLRLLPFIFEKKVVLHLFENGKLTENTYKPSKAKEKSEEEIYHKENKDLNTIYLFVENVFRVISVVGLFTASLNVGGKSSKPVSVNVIHSKDSSVKTLTDVSDIARKYPKVRTLTIDTVSAASQKPTYLTSTSTAPNRENDQRYKTLGPRFVSTHMMAIKEVPSTNSPVEIESKSAEKPKTKSYIDSDRYKRTLTYGPVEKINEEGESDSYSTPKRATINYQSPYLFNKEKNNIGSDVNKSYGEKYAKSIPSRNISMNVLNPSSDLRTPSTAGGYKTDSPVSGAKTYQPVSHHAKTASFGSYQSYNPQSATLSTESGRNSAESGHLELKKVQSPIMIPAKTEMPSNSHQRSLFGGKSYGSNSGQEAQVDNNVRLFFPNKNHINFTPFRNHRTERLIETATRAKKS